MLPFSPLPLTIPSFSALPALKALAARQAQVLSGLAKQVDGGDRPSPRDEAGEAEHRLKAMKQLESGFEGLSECGEYVHHSVGM